MFYGALTKVVAMRLLPLVLLGVVLVSTASPRAEGSEEAEDRARTEFQASCRPAIAVKDRVALLESFVRDHPDTRWTDDALWLLGEIYADSPYPERALAFRQALLARPDIPRLEEFTRSLHVYKQSRLPASQRVLQYTDNLYVRSGNTVLTYDPLLIIVHEDVARTHERAGRLDAALRHYRMARNLAPRGSLFRTNFAQRIQDIKTARELREQARAAHRAPAESKGDDGPLAQAHDSAQDEPEPARDEPEPSREDAPIADEATQ